MYSAAEGGLRKVWEDCPMWAVKSRTHPQSGRGETSLQTPGKRERLEEGRPHLGKRGDSHDFPCLDSFQGSEPRSGHCRPCLRLPFAN